ncbi:MAG: hypothetical protein V1782_07165 [Pseudomonadota bacterium]
MIVEIAVIPLSYAVVGREGEGFFFLRGYGLFGLADNAFGFGECGRQILARPHGGVVKSWLHGGKWHGADHDLWFYPIEK